MLAIETTITGGRTMSNRRDLPSLADQEAFLRGERVWTSQVRRIPEVVTRPAVSWYVVRSNPRCEERAFAGLVAKGFEAHLPRGVKNILRRYTRKPQPVRFPLLTGYMFVGMEASNEDFAAVRSTDGVKEILGRRLDDGSVGAAKRYVPISAAVVDAFRKLEVDGALGTTEPEGVRFAPGDSVEVKEGVLAGMVFVFDDYFGKASAKVVRDICGGYHPIQIELANLRKLP